MAGVGGGRPSGAGVGRVIAGVDGSAQCVAALRWAAEDARLRHSELVVVTGCGRDVPRSAAADVSACSAGRAAAEQACLDMQSRLLRTLPADPVGRRTSLVLRGDPAEVLARVATSDDVLVAGTRGHGRLASLLLGSVARGCAERAPCPVVIVPGAPDPAAPQAATGSEIVVGVDSSAAARQALRFAAAEAAMRGVRLVAVHAVYPDYLLAESPSAGNGAADRDLLTPLGSARAQLDVLVRSELAGARVPVKPVLVCGQPERVLLDLAGSACLVAVGSRGESRFHTALLGSVSTSLLRHAPCPVAVVPVPPHGAGAS